MSDSAVLAVVAAPVAIAIYLAQRLDKVGRLADVPASTELAQLLTPAGLPRADMATEDLVITLGTAVRELGTSRVAALLPLGEVGTLAAQAATALGEGDAERARALANAATADLRTAARDLTFEVADAERLAATDATLEALAGRGYELQTADDGLRSAIWADAGDHVMAVVVNPGGLVDLEVAGLDDTSCQPAVRGLLDDIGAGGSRVEGCTTRYHGDPDGVALIPGAARLATAEGIIMPEALLANADVGNSGQEPWRRTPLDAERARLRAIAAMAQGIG